MVHVHQAKSTPEIEQCGPVVGALPSRSGDPRSKTHSDHSLNLFLVHSPWFNFSAALVNSQLACLWPVGILNSCCCWMFCSVLIVFIGLAKPPIGSGQLSMYMYVIVTHWNQLGDFKQKETFQANQLPHHVERSRFNCPQQHYMYIIKSGFSKRRNFTSVIIIPWGHYFSADIINVIFSRIL